MFRVSNTEETIMELYKFSGRSGAESWGKPSFSKRKGEVTLVERARQDKRNQPTPPEIPLAQNQIIALVRMWIEDGVLRPLPVQTPPTPEETRNPKFCLFHKKIGHSTSDCYTVRKIYHEKAQRGEILLGQQQQRAENNPFPNHGRG